MNVNIVNIIIIIRCLIWYGLDNALNMVIPEGIRRGDCHKICVVKYVIWGVWGQHCKWKHVLKTKNSFKQISWHHHDWPIYRFSKPFLSCSKKKVSKPTNCNQNLRNTTLNKKKLIETYWTQKKVKKYSTNISRLSPTRSFLLSTGLLCPVSPIAAI